jgi:hypothetical protein
MAKATQLMPARSAGPDGPGRRGSASAGVIDPDLLPVPGVLFALVPTGAPDEYRVDMDTRGAGVAIGRVMLRHDGSWGIYTGQQSCGYAEDPEAAMWACIRAWLTGPAGARLVGAGFRTKD